MRRTKIEFITEHARQLINYHANRLIHANDPVMRKRWDELFFTEWWHVQNWKNLCEEELRDAAARACARESQKEPLK
jgi:hypothetical protein